MSVPLRTLQFDSYWPSPPHELDIEAPTDWLTASLKTPFPPFLVYITSSTPSTAHTMNSSTGKGNGAGVDKRTGLCSPARPSQDDQAPKASVAAPSGLAEGVAVPAQLKTEVFETETQTHETSAGCEGVDTLAPYHMAKWLEDFKVPLQPGATPPRPTLHRIDDPGTLSELDLDMKRTCQRSGDLPKVRWATPDDLEGIVNVYCASMRHHKVFYEVVFQGTLRRNIYNMIAGSGEKFIVAEVPGLLVGALSYRVYDEHGRVEGEGGKSDQRPVVLRPRMGALWGEWNDAQKVVWEAYANSSKGKRHMCKPYPLRIQTDEELTERDQLSETSWSPIPSIGTASPTSSSTRHSSRRT